MDVTGEVKELGAALRRLAKIARSTPGQAILSFSDDMLHIEWQGAKSSLPATGHASGELRIPGRLLLGMARCLPKSGRFHLIYEEGRLTCGDWSVTVEQQPRHPRRVFVPVNPDLPTRLRLRELCSDDELREAGILEVVEAAVKEKAKCMLVAAKSLAEFGVTEKDLEEVLQRRLSRIDLTPSHSGN